MKKKKDGLHLTYIGTIIDSNDTDTLILDELMRKFQSAKRYSRERIFEGKSRKEVENLTKPLFISNSRYMRDAFSEAESSITSQEELLPTYVLQNDIKIEKLHKEIDKLQSRIIKNISRETMLKYWSNGLLGI